MNEITAYKEIPDWFIGEIDDLLHLLEASDNNPSKNVVSIPQISYLKTLPDRLYREGFITGDEKYDFLIHISHFLQSSRSSVSFLISYVFYMYQAGFIDKDFASFKRCKDILILKVKETWKKETSIIKGKVDLIVSVDQLVYPETLEGAVVHNNDVIIDANYTSLKNSSKKMISILQKSDTIFDLYFIDIISFYSDLLNNGYIDSNTYANLVHSIGEAVPVNICIGILYALSMGFYEDDHQTKQSIMNLIDQYFGEHPESGLQDWATEIFENTDWN